MATAYTIIIVNAIICIDIELQIIRLSLLSREIPRIFLQEFFIYSYKMQSVQSIVKLKISEILLNMV